MSEIEWDRWHTHFQNDQYGRELTRISPEGNSYGQIRWVRDWQHYVWWDGGKYRDYVTAGQLNSLAELPSGRQSFGLIYEVKIKSEKDGKYYWRAYFYDSSIPSDPWRPLKTLWDVNAYSDLPVPGIQIGALHRVMENNVLVMWTGFQWERLKHSVLDNDEEERHLPPGFLDWLIPDVQVTYVNEYELMLEGVEGGTGIVFVGGDLITASPDTAVFSDTPALNLVGGVLTQANLEANTEYWIYLANTESTAYNKDDWDYRGRLFLSTTTPVDGYLGSGLGTYARLAGRIETTNDTTFARELDISLISNRSSLTHAFREYSDYVVEFVDESTLSLKKLDGTYGQIFVPDSLRYVGFDYNISRTDDWIDWDEEIDGYLTRMSSSLTINTRYYIYMAGMVDAFNFNEVNPTTARPWQETDEGAEDNYVSALDFRIKPFLSPKEPDHGRLAETWPGFYTRWIGQVQTDENGKFINARDLSVIRQPTLNPTFFDGLAEITFISYGETEFRVAKIRSTSGIVNVGGEAIQTYDKDDTAHVHKALNSAIVQDYDEETPTAPLSDLYAVSTYTSELLYLYLANSRSLWGDYAEKIFFSTTAPTGGYLSRNWPGNQARWLANVRISTTGKFKGSYIEDAVRPPSFLLDDLNISSNEGWSSQKIWAEFQKVYLQIGAQAAFDQQKTQGCSVRFEYVDKDTAKLYPEVSGTTVIFPDLTYLEIPDAGVTLDVSSSAVTWNTLYYVYLNDTGLYVSTSEPDTVYDALECYNGDSVLVGRLSSGGLPEYIDDIEFSSRSDFVTRERKGDITNWVRDSAYKGHFTDGSNPLSLGPGNDCPLVRKYHTVVIGGTPYVIVDITGDGSGTNGVELDGDPASNTVSSLYAEVIEDGVLMASGVWAYDGADNPSIAYATPDMTSNTSPSPNIVSCDPSSNAAYYVFNRSLTTGKTASTDPTYGATDIYFDAGAGNGHCINKWRINSGSSIGGMFSYISSAKLYGSNVASPDPEDWVELDSETFTFTTFQQWSSYRTFTNSTSYRHHRIEITGISGNVLSYLWEAHLVAAVRLCDSDIIACCSGASLQEDASLWSHICQVARINPSDPSGAIAYAAVSFDDKATWKVLRSGAWTDVVRFNTVWQYHDGTSWQDASEDSMIVALEEAIRDSDNQTTWASIEALVQEDWADTNGFDPSDNYFDFAVGLKPDVANGSPSYEGITIERRIGHKHLADTWNIWSFYNQSAREWSVDIADFQNGNEVDDVVLDLPGFFIPENDGGGQDRTEETSVKFWYGGGSCYATVWGIGYDSCIYGELTVAYETSPLSELTFYHMLKLTHDIEKTYPTYNQTITALNGVYKVYWNGQD